MEHVLDLIYDCAGEHHLWSAALSEIADLTRSEGGIPFGQSVVAEQVYFDFNGRLNPECNRVYQQHHMQNAWSVAMEEQPVGHLVLSDEVVHLGELGNSAFHDEVLRPQGIGHNAMIALAASDNFRVAFNICRSERQGAFEDNERRIFEVLAPHLRRSVTLGFHLTGYRALRDAAFETIERAFPHRLGEIANGLSSSKGTAFCLCEEIWLKQSDASIDHTGAGYIFHLDL